MGSSVSLRVSKYRVITGLIKDGCVVILGQTREPQDVEWVRIREASKSYSKLYRMNSKEKER